jgi:hypothetical protein
MAVKPAKLVRGLKKKDVNLTLFYRRFPVFSALSYLYEDKEIKESKKDSAFFKREQLVRIITEEEENRKDDPNAHEKAMVRHISCDGKNPLCLYDFTLKAVMLDHLPLSIPDLESEVIIEDYFYPHNESDEESKELANHRAKPEAEAPGAVV